VPGIDPAATPAYAASCIAQAIQFGDFNYAQSNVSPLVAGRPGWDRSVNIVDRRADPRGNNFRNRQCSSRARSEL
jgi:hypothetical protein